MTTTVHIIIWVAVGLLVVGFIIPAIVLGLVLFNILLVRTKPTKWPRGCMYPEVPEYKAMYDEARAWAEAHDEQMKEVRVKSGKLTLAGQYFDLGFKRAVIIIPGRTETCLYTTFFAAPYEKAGYNILAIDNRAHGASEGKINCAGYREYQDIRAWGKLLHDEYGMEEIVIHGVCIGSSTALYTLVFDGCPDYFKGMVAEGMFVNFYSSTKLHYLHMNSHLFPIFYTCILWMWIIYKHWPGRGPEYYIEKLDKPILFLHSKQDSFSLPEVSQRVYDKCRAPHKLVWFETGEHSRVRAKETEKYDQAVIDFLAEYFPQTK